MSAVLSIVENPMSTSDEIRHRSRVQTRSAGDLVPGDRLALSKIVIMTFCFSLRPSAFLLPRRFVEAYTPAQYPATYILDHKPYTQHNAARSSQPSSLRPPHLRHDLFPCHILVARPISTSSAKRGARDIRATTERFDRRLQHTTSTSSDQPVTALRSRDQQCCTSRRRDERRSCGDVECHLRSVH